MQASLIGCASTGVVEVAMFLVAVLSNPGNAPVVENRG